DALDHTRAAHVSAEAAHRALLDELGLAPLLDLGMRLGEASGAAVAVAVLRAALACHTGMATFAEAGVAGKATESSLRAKRALRLRLPRSLPHENRACPGSQNYAQVGQARLAVGEGQGGGGHGLMRARPPLPTRGRGARARCSLPRNHMKERPTHRSAPAARDVDGAALGVGDL